MRSAAEMQRARAPAGRHARGEARRGRGAMRAAAQPPARAPPDAAAPPGAALSVLGATRGSLVEAVLEQARRDAWPRIAELVEPLLAAPPPPLRDVAPPATLADADSRFVSLLGVDVHYKVEHSDASSSSEDDYDDASTSGDVLLCLHGFNGSTFSFRDVLRPLALRGAPSGARPAFRAVAFDRPPFGLSSRPRPSELPPGAPDPYSDAGAVELARALLGRLRARRVVILGHSAGAAVALALARALPPASLAGVVLVSPAVPASSDPRDSFLGRADLGTWLRLAALRAVAASDAAGATYVRRQTLRRAAEVRQSRDIGYADKKPAPDAAVDGYLLPLKAERWDEGTLAQLRAFSAGGALAGGAAGPPRPDELGVPFLIIQGAQDAITPAPNARKLAAALGAACEYVEMPGVGHLPMEEAPADFIAAVGPWMQRALAAAAARDAPAAPAAAMRRDGGARLRGGEAAQWAR